jgi:phosphoesterase RecJ-like protein
MSVMSRDPDTAVDRLRRAERVLVTSHRSPDGDALGSELALAELLEGLGLHPVIANHDAEPSYLSQLPGLDRIQVGSSLPASFPDDFDLVVTVECPDIDRPGFDALDRLPIVNIDHHKANSCYGEINYLDEEAPAVGEMVWRMFQVAGIEPSADAATNMYVALSTDTGDFRYSNATSRAFHAAAALADAGARPPQVAEWIHERRSAASIHLLGEALRTLELGCEGRLATFSVNPEAFANAGAVSADTEDLIAVPRSIDGVLIVAFFKQWEPGAVRVSLRSKGSLDVRSVAAQFGGGGHTNAAGCTINGDLETARQQVTTLLTQLLDPAS